MGGMGEDTLERTPALIFPRSILTYSDMMNEAQMEGLVAAVQLPIMRMNWFLRRNGARASTLRRISRDYGLPIEGEDGESRGARIGGRFNFFEHLELALEALTFGFQFFEQVGEIQLQSRGGDGFWHLRKLAVRLPQTISEIRVDRDGGLQYIRQGFGIDAPEIPVETLVAYVWRRRGANWVGRSMLRSCYGAWLLKNRVLRVGAINIERAGAGTPIIEAPPGATEPEIQALDRMAQRFKAGSRSGGAIPNGARMQLMGINGTQPDVTRFVELCNEEMARSFLAMFIQLGQSRTGSRALGDSFIEFFILSLEAIAEWFATTFTAHQIENDVDWNEGEAAAAPALGWTWGDAKAPIADLAKMIEVGAIQVEEELENAIRRQWRMPLRVEPRITPPTPSEEGEGVEVEQETGEIDRGESSPGPAATAKRRTRTRRAHAAISSPAALPLPSRPLRRQLYAHEIQASVDFARLDSTWQSNVDLLVLEVRQLQLYQIDQLHDAIVAAQGDLDTLSELVADPVSADVIGRYMVTVAEASMTEAMREAERQGIQPERPDMEDFLRSLQARAEVVDRVITRELSESAVRNAVRLTGGGLEPNEVANNVKSHLLGLSGSGMRDRLGGALSTAQNGSRGLLFRRGDAQRIYASELLDQNTCAACTSIDGTQYETMAQAEQEYATGGYNDCAGADRCRGTLVAVWEPTNEGETGES